MREVRLDVFTNNMSIIVKDREKRPMDTTKNEDYIKFENIYEKTCPFCRGNEAYTTDTTFEIKDAYGWISKSVYNKYPILDVDCKELYGIHEVIIDTYRHNGNFYNMSEEEFYNMFKIYQNRYKNLIEDDKVKYVSIFKNFLNKAGASLNHPHSQIISMSIIPKDILNEVNILENYYINKKENLYYKTIKEEIKLKERVVYNGDKFIALIPYASMYSGEIRIICKDSTKFEYLGEDNIKELSKIFKALFKKIYNVCGYIPFNLCMHAHPKYIKDEKLFNIHFHIVPRKYNFGGFEIGNGVYVSSKAPEDFAKELYIE